MNDRQPSKRRIKLWQLSLWALASGGAIGGFVGGAVALLSENLSGPDPDPFELFVLGPSCCAIAGATLALGILALALFWQQHFAHVYKVAALSGDQHPIKRGWNVAAAVLCSVGLFGLFWAHAGHAFLGATSHLPVDPKCLAIDTHGNELPILHPLASMVGDYHDGLASEWISFFGWSFCDHKGRIVISGPFEDVQGGFSEGLAAVRDNFPRDSYYYIDRRGNDVFHRKFFRARRFAEGLAPATAPNKKYGYLDHQGHWAIRPQFSEACCFVEGQALVCDGNESPGAERWHYIDKLGRALASPRFTASPKLWQGIMPARAEARNDSLVGYVDEAGRWIIKPQFVYASDFDRGCAIVIGPKNKDSTYHMSAIDRHGNILQSIKILNPVPPAGEEQKLFNAALALVPPAPGTVPLGLKLQLDDQTKKWGYADRSGRFVILPHDPPVGAREFSEGLAVVPTRSVLQTYLFHGKPASRIRTICGIIDHSGHLVPISLKDKSRCIEHITDFHEGVAFVQLMPVEMGKPLSSDGRAL